MTLFRHLPWLLAATAAPAAAAEFEQIELLEARIVATLGAAIGEPGGPSRPVDRRLKLVACPGSPDIAMSGTGAAVVRCASAGWRIYVPLVRKPVEKPAEAERIVHKGDQVEVMAQGSSFTVSTFAVAEQDGAAGERIRVRVSPKSAPVMAEVTGQGRVAIAGFK